LHCALDRSHGARELGGDIVTRRIDDASAMLVYARADVLAALLYGAHGGGFVLSLPPAYLSALGDFMTGVLDKVWLQYSAPVIKTIRKEWLRARLRGVRGDDAGQRLALFRLTFPILHGMIGRGSGQALSSERKAAIASAIADSALAD